MRKYPHYGTANDNSFIGDIVRFIDQHAHLKPFEKDLLVNRITERYTGDSVEVKIAHLAMGIAVPEMFATKFADELDAIPLGTAQEERQRAKLWMEDAGRYARNEAYWREKRAYPAEECVRILSSMLNAAVGSVGAVNAGMDPRWLALINHVLSWGRPENPEQYHAVSSESAKIDDLKWLDNVVPRTANVSKPFTDQRFSAVQEFPGGKLGSVEQNPPGGKMVVETVVTDADVLKLISAYKDLGAYNARTDWNAISNLIGKMEVAIAENAKVGKPDGVWVSRERLDQLEHAEDNLRVLKEHETHNRSMTFAELLDVHQRGAASLQHIGYLFLAAMREDKCFAIKMGPSVEISGSPGTDERPINAFGYTNPQEVEEPKKRRVILQDMSAQRILGHYDVDDFHLTDDGFGNVTLRFSTAGVPQLKIVQGANGDYFVQHKGGLWRIEANGVIGAGVDAWRSFCNVLAELGTPQGGAAAGNESGEPSLVVLDAARFQELNEAEDHLVALKAAGVDNWEGYVGPNGFKDE